jgi:hypothetical protein
MTADDFEADFRPADPARVVIDRLLRGMGRRVAAEELGTSLATVNQYVAQAVREWSAEGGTQREAVAMLHAGLDDITHLTYATLDRDLETVAPLLDVLLGVHRLRAGLLAATKTRRATDG